MINFSKPLIGAAFALTLMGTAAYAATGGGGAGGTTSPNASANPGSVQTPRPATTTTPSNANQTTIMRDPAPGEKANPPHIVSRHPVKSHATGSPSGSSSGPTTSNPG